MDEEQDIKPVHLLPSNDLLPSKDLGKETSPGLEANDVAPDLQGYMNISPQFRKSRSKITDITRREIIKFYLQNPNMNQGEVADMFGIDRTTVSKLVKRRHEFLEYGEEMAIEAAVAAERALYENPTQAKRFKATVATATDNFGELYRKFQAKKRIPVMERKPTKFDRKTNTEEPQNNYIYLPPDEWQPGPPILESSDPQMKKVLMRKTTKYHYQYKMTKAPKPKPGPSSTFPMVDSGAPSNMMVLKQIQNRNPSLMTKGFKQGPCPGLSTNQIKLPDEHDLIPHDPSAYYYDRTRMLMALSKTNNDTDSDNDVAQDLSKSTTTTSDKIKIKDEPMMVDNDERVTYQGDSDAESEQSLIKKSFTLPPRGNPKKVYQPGDLELAMMKESLASLAGDSGIDDEYLMQYFINGKAAAMNMMLGGFPRKEHGRNSQRRMPASETATSGTPLDPSMSLKVAPQNNSSNQSSHRKPKEKPESKEKTPVTPASEDPVDLSGVKVKEETADDLETDDTKVLSHEIKSLEKFREQQKAIEEANIQKKALLSRTLTERRKKARQEAHKLEHIQKELAKLDSLLTADVQVIRERIEEASRDFLEAQKRFQKAETEYVDSKMDLYEKSEQKEQLTEHLYTIIHQNEVRKAKKLAQLMKELEMESSEEEVQLPELPPLSSFSPLQLGHKSPVVSPHSPGKGPVSPVIENGPTAQAESAKISENKSGDKRSEEQSVVNDKKTSSDKSSGEKVTEKPKDVNSKADDRSDSKTIANHSREGEVENKAEKETQNAQSEQKTEENNSSGQSCEPKSPGPEANSPNSDRVPTAGGDAGRATTTTVNSHSITDHPETVKVGQVMQYVKDRQAHVNEELETVQNLMKETETVIELDKEKTPSSWDFSGDVNKIGETSKS